jgi:hypothetical protein
MKSFCRLIPANLAVKPPTEWRFPFFMDIKIARLMVKQSQILRF